jgi:hypothetical protein
MHRLTARWLLFFALVGNLVPLALAATSSPRACCLRKGVHHCQDSLAPESEPLVVRDANCCNHDYCRAVTAAKWAYPQPRLAVFSLQAIDAHVGGIQPDSPATASANFQSSRAPPTC